jgi:hypothetical protein
MKVRRASLRADGWPPNKASHDSSLDERHNSGDRGDKCGDRAF